VGSETVHLSCLRCALRHRRRYDLENMDAGKTGLSPECAHAAREVADTANAAQSDRHPTEDYMKSLFAETPLP
jgi:hypothetical protein